MKNIKVLAHIKSLNGQLDYITIIDKYILLGNIIKNKFICSYKGINCLAIFNTYNQEYYVDDINSVLN